MEGETAQCSRASFRLTAGPKPPAITDKLIRTHPQRPRRSHRRAPHQNKEFDPCPCCAYKKKKSPLNPEN